MARVLFENAAVQVQFGDAFTGAAPVFTGALASCMGTAKRLEVNDELKKTDVHGAGEGRVLNRYHSEESTLSMDHFVPSTGYQFATLGTGSMVGKSIKITVVPKSTLATPDTYVGVITKWTASYAQGEGTMEKVEVDLNADYDAAE